MSIQTRTYLYQQFINGSFPDEQDYWDIIDTLISKSGEDNIYLVPPQQNLPPWVGIGTRTPGAPLGINAYGGAERLISFNRNDTTTVWGINQVPNVASPGLTIVKVLQSNNNVPCFFISENSYRVGVGSITPLRKLHVEESNPDGFTGICVVNTASTAVQKGWSLAHVNDNTVPERNGAFALKQEPRVVSDPSPERLVVLSNGFVGINTTPDTQLHVSKPEANTDAPVALMAGTGIAEFGELGNHIVVDFEGVQKRSGVYLGSGVYQYDPSTLHINKLGGDVLLRGKSSLQDTQRVIFKDDGSVGIGIGANTPQDKLHVNGAIVIGSNVNTLPVAGTMRWSGTAFEGFDGTAWQPFVSADSLWAQVAVDQITYNTPDAKVGVGVPRPLATLHIGNDSETTSGSTAVLISNQATTTSSSASDYRAGLSISCTGNWSSDPNSKNIGLFVSQVSGPAASNVNLAAVLNGNVVVGALTPTSDMVGMNGTNVLVLQNGLEPTTPVGDPTAGTSAVQLYAQVNADNTAYLKAKLGSGDTLSFFKGGPLEPANPSTVDETYGLEEMNVINNLRMRVNQLETLLRSFGLLT